MPISIPHDLKQPLKVYLAGPGVFLPNAIELGEMQKRAIEKIGCIGYFPMDNTIENFLPNEDTAYRIADANETMIENCDVVLADLTPYHRSPSADVGTVCEIGQAGVWDRVKPQGVLVIGYRTEAIDLDFSRRVIKVMGGQILPDKIVDGIGNTIENFRLSDNLMPIAIIQRTGGKEFNSFQEAVDHIIPLWLAKQAKRSY